MTRVPTNRDLVGGALLFALGVAVAAYTWTHYDIGKLKFVGPGAFPLGAGVLLALLGIVVALAGLRDSLQAEPYRWSDFVRTVFAVKLEDFGRVVLAIVSFALLIQPFGAIVAVAALTAISMCTRDRSSWWQVLIVTVVISAASIALFQYGLGLRFAAIRWPF